MRLNPKELEKVKLKELALELPKTHIKISCPSCHTEVVADNINIQDKIAKCGSCNSVFPFHEELFRVSPPSEIPKQTFFRPEGIDVFRYKGELELTVSTPFKIGEGIFFAFFLFLSLALSYVCFVEALPLLFSIASLGLALFSSFALIATIYRQKYRINIDRQNLTIQHRPKYFSKDKSFYVRDIDQVYVKKLEGSNTVNAVYIIINNPTGQKHINVIHSLYSYTKAKYLEQEIENHLGIIDREVPEAS